MLDMSLICLSLSENCFLSLSIQPHSGNHGPADGLMMMGCGSSNVGGLVGVGGGIGNNGGERVDSGLMLSHCGNSGAARLAGLPLPLTACHRCDVCGKLLSTKLTLKRHKEQQHLQPLNNAICNLCHKVFRTLNSLNNHKSIYHRRQKQPQHPQQSTAQHQQQQQHNHHSAAAAAAAAVAAMRDMDIASLQNSGQGALSQARPQLVAKPCIDFLWTQFGRIQFGMWMLLQHKFVQSSWICVIKTKTRFKSKKYIITKKDKLDEWPYILWQNDKQQQSPGGY